MRLINIITLSLLSTNLFSQTGIGKTSPDPSAKLDIYSTNKGFLPPRVSLTGTTDVSTITNPQTGLLVYCKGDAGLSAGYYYWNGAVWTTIATAGGSGSVAAEYGAKFLGNTTISVPTSASNAATTILSFTLPSAGTWEITSFLRAQNSASTFAAEFGIYDPAGTLVPNSEVLSGYGLLAATGTGVIQVTTTGAATYTLRAFASTGTYLAYDDGNGRTGVTWKKISGNTPMTVINYGDIKTGMQSADHNGWIKLNGRAKSTLSATQQAQATALGIGTNLPNATNTFLVQNGTTLGSVSGSNSKTITQANLPNINFPTATTSTNGDHTHWISAAAYDDRNFSNQGTNSQQFGLWSDAGSYTTSDPNSNLGRNSLNAGNHNHTVTVSSGGSGTALDITPQSLSVNTFIYLGY